MHLLWRTIARYVAKGYQPIEECPSALRRRLVFEDTPGRTEQLFPPLSDGKKYRVLMILPTYYSRSTLEQHLELISSTCRQILAALDRNSDVAMALVVGMQWTNGEESAAISTLSACVDLAKSFGINLIGISLLKTRKVSTLNAAIDIGNLYTVDGVAWIDDDVTLEENCVSSLVERFILKGCCGAVGATKIGQARANLASQLLSKAKQLTMPASNYPHGCCILVSRAVVSSGIPRRYVSDDGYVCFELLDPARANPLEMLELVPDAHCYHFVGGTAPQTVRRIKRMITNHLVFLADYPPETSRYYFKHILFHGLWPLSPLSKELPIKKRVLKSFLKTLYLVWFTKVALTLFIRGVTKRPFREIAWGGIPDAAAPGIPKSR